MNKIIYAGIAAAILMASCSSAANVEAQSRPEAANAPRPAGKLDIPMMDLKLIYAQPFKVEDAFTHYWEKERKQYKSGTLIVIEADKDFIFPRNTLEPVLYAGTQTVQRLNQGHLSGRVIGIIPGEQDLSALSIWYGAPALPERLTDDVIEEQFSAAQKAGLKSIPNATIDMALVEPVQEKNLTDYLRKHAADVVLRFSPEEKSLAQSWRLPISETEVP